MSTLRSTTCLAGMMKMEMMETTRLASPTSQEVCPKTKEKQKMGIERTMAYIK